MNRMGSYWSGGWPEWMEILGFLTVGIAAIAGLVYAIIAGKVILALIMAVCSMPLIGFVIFYIRHRGEF